MRFLGQLNPRATRRGLIAWVVVGGIAGLIAGLVAGLVDRLKADPTTGGGYVFLLLMAVGSAGAAMAYLRVPDDGAAAEPGVRQQSRAVLWARRGAAVFSEEADGDVTRITVVVPWPNAPPQAWARPLRALMGLPFVGITLWMVVRTVRLCRGSPALTRAVFEIGGGRFKMTLRDPSLDQVMAFDWPLAAVAEARANRYDRGLWVDVPEHVKETYLCDLPREAIVELGAALMALVPGSLSTAATGPAR